MRSALALSLLIAAVATPAIASGNGPAAEATAATATPKQEKVKCRRIDQTSAGSNLKKWTRVCKPESEWNPDRVTFERSLEAMKENGLVNPDGAPGAASLARKD